MHRKICCRERFSTGISLSLSPNQDTECRCCYFCSTLWLHVDHLHDYQYLCRYIDEIWMFWAVFLLENPAAKMGTHFGVVPFCVINALLFSLIILKWSTRSKISFHLLVSSSPCSHILTPRPPHIPPPLSVWTSVMIGFHLSALQGVFVVCHPYHLH